MAEPYAFVDAGVSNKSDDPTHSTQEVETPLCTASVAQTSTLLHLLCFCTSPKTVNKDYLSSE